MRRGQATALVVSLGWLCAFQAQAQAGDATLSQPAAEGASQLQEAAQAAQESIPDPGLAQELAQDSTFTALPMVGEEFTYAVDFTGVVGAYIKVKVGAGPDHQPDSRVLTAYLATTPLIKEVWLIRDKMMALYDPSQGRTLATRLWEEENGRRMFREERFVDSGVEVVEKRNAGHKDFVVDSKQPLLDAFSALFELRRRPLLNGSVETARIYLNRKVYDCNAKVSHETLRYQGEDVAAIRVEPELSHGGKQISGVGFTFWLSADSKRVPLRLEADISYGKVAGTLLPANAAH